MRYSSRLETYVKDFLLFFKWLAYEVLLVVFLTLLVHWVQDISFTRAFCSMYSKLSLVTIGAFGSEVLWAIDQKKWHFRKANEEYPIYPALLLIIINATTGPLMIHSDKRFIILLIPVSVCLATFIESIIKRKCK